MNFFPVRNLARSIARRPHRVISALVFGLMCVAASLLGIPAVAASPHPDASSVSYFKDITPIVREHCAGCHQPSVKQGDLSLTTYELLMAGGAKG